MTPCQRSSARSSTVATLLLLTALCLAVLSALPQALAHGDDPHEPEEVGEEAGDALPWSLGAGAPWLLVTAMAVIVLVLLLRAPSREPSGTVMGTVFLVIALGIAGVVVGGLVDDGGGRGGQADLAQERASSQGPAQGPGHMAHFYENFDPEDAPQASEIVLHPASLPAPVNTYPTLDGDGPSTGQGLGVPVVTPRTHAIDLVVRERVAPLTDASTYYYWTYDGTVPGPILRVRAGDTVALTLENEALSTHNHSIDLHAVGGPGGGAVATDVPPGDSATFGFEANEAGFYVYHCGSPNVPTHLANQMFGGIIVEPPEGLPAVDREFVVFQGELYTVDPMGADGFQALDPFKMLDEQPTYYTFNGRPHGLTGDYALEAGAGETVRIYFGNAGVSKTSAFHVIGEQFDRVWRDGALADEPDGPGVQTVAVAPGSSTVVDLTLDEAGTYPVVDHALSRIDRGAWGVLDVG